MYVLFSALEKNTFEIMALGFFSYKQILRTQKKCIFHFNLNIFNYNSKHSFECADLQIYLRSKVRKRSELDRRKGTTNIIHGR